MAFNGLFGAIKKNLWDKHFETSALPVGGSVHISVVTLHKFNPPKKVIQAKVVQTSKKRFDSKLGVGLIIHSFSIPLRKTKTKAWAHYPLECL